MSTDSIQKIVLNSNQTIETIYSRRSIRSFKEISVSRDLIEKILDAGRMAPSALNRQPWMFYVVTNRDLIKTMSKEIAKVSLKHISKIGLKEIAKSIWHYIHSPHDLGFLKQSDFVFHKAPLVIFVAAPKNNEWAPLDIGMCCQNMMLAAKSLGLESCPIGIGKYIEETEIASVLRIPENETVQLAIIIGYGNESPEAKERSKNNASYFD